MPDFSTATIAATIVATWIAGSSLTLKVSETYTKGLYFIIANLADPLSFLLIGYFLAPRMKEFLGKLSVAEVMGDLYGNKVRIITSLAAACVSIGYVGLQVKVIAILLNYFFNIGSVPALLLTISCIVLYSSFGGIKAVTFTDTLQIFTFGVFIPGLTIIILGTLSDPELITNTLTQNQLFDWKELFSFNNPKFLNWLLLFFYCLIPALDPAVFQRISMAASTTQVRKSFFVAAGFVTILCLLMYFIGILLLATNPDFEATNLIGYIIDNYSYTGLKGITIIGILAMAMSTADSYINSAAILLAYDVPAGLNVNIPEKQQLLLSRILSAIVGILAIVPALLTKSFMNTLIHVSSFYMPVVTVPFLLAIFGFRSTSKVILIGMVGGICAVIMCNTLNVNIEAVIPGMIANLLLTLGSHYLLKQPGGWIGIKDDADIRAIRLKRKEQLNNILYSIKFFSLKAFCEKNSPKYESIYTFFAIFSLISIFSTFYSIPNENRQQHKEILEIIYHSVLVISTLFLTYPIWPPTLKNKNIIYFSWQLALPYTLIFVPTILIIISNFGQFQLMTFMVNLIILATLVRWQVALPSILITVIMGISFYKWFIIPAYEVSTDFTLSLQFKIMYALILISSVLLVFLKPKQEYIEQTEQKAEVLEDRNVKLCSKVTGLNTQVTDLNCKVGGLNTLVGDLNEQVHHYVERAEHQQKELDRLAQTSQRILNNVNHELRLPIGNVVNFADMLYDTLNKSENNELAKQMAEEVHKNSYRVSSMILNMLDLATLQVQKVDLEKKIVNLSEIVEDRVSQCRKIYLKNKQLRFKLEIEPDIFISIDPNYIRQTVDNLVINAINFSEKGIITISLKKEGNEAVFIITDQGKGIPKPELYTIFEPFRMASNSESKACGRGVGLTLCKSAVQAHGGSIIANSDGVCRARLQFNLPFETEVLP